MLKLATIIVTFFALCIGGQAAEWGSIAFSPSTGANGYSHNYDTKPTAQSWAMYYCGQNASDCRIVTNFQNACGALARGSNGGWGANWGTTRANAEANAINACRGNDRGCRVTRWVCSR